MSGSLITTKEKTLDAWSGKFDLVDPRTVVVDHRYQRDEKENLIATIAANPDWAAFGALSLYERNGTLVCVDGQQRLRGVMTSDNPPKLVPAVIQPEANIKREAMTFAAVNINRRPPESMEKHRALVVAENSVALAIERAVDTAGFSLEQGKTTSGDVNTIQAIRALYVIHKRIGEAGLVQVLIQARDSWPEDPLALSANMLYGISQVLIDLGETYNRAKVTAALGKSVPSLILRRSEGLRFDKGGSKQVNVRRALKELCKI